MYSYIIESAGKFLELTGVERKWQLLEVTGLNPPRPTVSTSTVTGMDGVVVNNMKLPARYLEFTLHINAPCTANRLELINFLLPKQEVRVHIKGKGVAYYIDGYVELNEYNVYTASQIMVISIVCEKPPFINEQGNTQYNLISSGGFSFPLNFEEKDTFKFDVYSVLDRLQLINYGQVENGLQLEIHVINSVTDPKIVNVDDETKFIGLTGTFNSGDIIKIDTNVGARNKVMLVRDGKETRIMNRLMRGITWLKIRNVLTLAYTGNGYDVYILVKNHDGMLGI